ncbi:MAG: glycosyltransferase [Rhizobiales bacterium]|nr:glycosyltransferase [Hyphomicrobiales bacterium]
MVGDQSPTVYIILGVFNPSLPLFEQQLHSLLGQSFKSLKILLILDGPQALDVTSLAASFRDERLVALPISANVGVHANFARGLKAALERSQNKGDLFAFCDQDDVWHRDKVARQVELMTAHPEYGLCHSDARLVDMAGNVIAASVFDYEKRSKQFGLMDLLVMNSVTGMTAMSTRTVAELACPFPMSGTKEILHDHWLALVAAAHSRVGFLDQVLVDYVQHGTNQLGAFNPSPRRAPLSNLVFGGREYWQRCVRQYAWRIEAHQALARLCGPSIDLSAADLSDLSGGVRLIKHMTSAWMSGETRQAAQSWRLLAGKMFGAC